MIDCTKSKYRSVFTKKSGDAVKQEAHTVETCFKNESNMLCSCGWFVLSQCLDTCAPRTSAQLQGDYAVNKMGHVGLYACDVFRSHDCRVRCPKINIIIIVNGEGVWWEEGGGAWLSHVRSKVAHTH